MPHDPTRWSVRPHSGAFALFDESAYRVIATCEYQDDALDLLEMAEESIHVVSAEEEVEKLTRELQKVRASNSSILAEPAAFIRSYTDRAERIYRSALSDLREALESRTFTARLRSQLSHRFPDYTARLGHLHDELDALFPEEEPATEILSTP